MLRVAWSPDGSKVSAGSGDRHVYVWDTTSRRILYKLPGHAGSVNDIDFHPIEPISTCRVMSRMMLCLPDPTHPIEIVSR